MTNTKESSKHIRALTQVIGKPEYLQIAHKGARRANCLNAINRAMRDYKQAKLETAIEAGLHNRIGYKRTIKVFDYRTQDYQLIVMD